MVPTYNGLIAYPVVYLAVPDRIVDAIAGTCCCRKGFVADEEVEIFGASLSRQMSTRSSTARQK
jgi:hypothetical protein